MKHPTELTVITINGRRNGKSILSLGVALRRFKVGTRETVIINNADESQTAERTAPLTGRKESCNYIT